VRVKSVWKLGRNREGNRGKEEEGVEGRIKDNERKKEKKQTKIFFKSRRGQKEIKMGEKKVQRYCSGMWQV